MVLIVSKLLTEYWGTEGEWVVAAETVAAIRVALAWGYLNQADVAQVLALNDRLLAMLWRLTQR